MEIGHEVLLETASLGDVPSTERARAALAGRRGAGAAALGTGASGHLL